MNLHFERAKFTKEMAKYPKDTNSSFGGLKSSQTSDIKTKKIFLHKWMLINFRDWISIFVFLFWYHFSEHFSLSRPIPLVLPLTKLNAAEKRVSKETFSQDEFLIRLNVNTNCWVLINVSSFARCNNNNKNKMRKVKYSYENSSLLQRNSH